MDMALDPLFFFFFARRTLHRKKKEAASLSGSMNRALACIGAVVGAGFASGREVVVFFTQYGWLSWLLILLSTGCMCTICTLLMRKMQGFPSSNWCQIYDGKDKSTHWVGEGCVLLLMGITGGAMLSASGHLVALVLPAQEAYWIGMLATLTLSYLASRKNTKPLAAVSGVLIVGMLIAYITILSLQADTPLQWVRIDPQLTFWQGVKAAAFAVAYACMNIAIAIGVICSCAHTDTKGLCRSALLFGMILTGLLFISNAMLLRYPQAIQNAFPILTMLKGFGRTGFLLSATTLYLAVFTTLTAVLHALRDMAICHPKLMPWKWGIVVCVPLAFSLVGFEKIVENLYAPIGLGCLLVIILPAIAGKKGKKKTHV